MRAVIVAFDDFTDIDLFLAWDLLKRVPQLETSIVAATPSIVSSTGVRIEVHGGLDEVAGADGVYVTSGRGTRKLAEDAAWLRALGLDPPRQVIAAVDSGTLILAALGLLAGKRATTYPSPDLHERLAKLGVQRVDEALVVEDRIATAAQCLAGVDLVRWFVTQLVGGDAAEAACASVQRLPL